MAKLRTEPQRAPQVDVPDFPIAAADLIVALGRGLTVIESFDDEHPRMTAAMVGERTGIPRTAARRHLLSLCHFGYAQTDGKHFWLAPRVLRLGRSYLGAARMPRLVQPFIQRLSMASGETVNVSLLDGHEVVYVARSNSPRLVSIGFHVGDRAPAHVVSPGVVLLSRLPDRAVQRWVQEHEFAGFSPVTLTDRDAFLEKVRGARRLDHWITQQQLDAGLMGVAVPLLDRHGKCQAALSMTLQVPNWPHAAIEEKLVPALRDTALTLLPLL
ncbi:IclR family transcriptional regulator [Rubrivivax sp. A210]|uniref:IclR family transcriptional regulator domain-containing protein n=1 Tax=Rubrivivax sp. A210 TaxID=2772301 RepID=UPI00191A3715|nr:IclR family transcriptional regulator C-terminal domain-containing protein [Rubrivivax sp. A210]CAD5375160.1 IclR family transcriptional regulator [Rubrivivax sp. A210]